MDLEPRLERLLKGLGDRDFAFAAALAMHVEVVVAGVGTRAAQDAGPQPSELSQPQPIVAEDTQERVIALARQ